MRILDAWISDNQEFTVDCYQYLLIFEYVKLGTIVLHTYLQRLCVEILFV
jgi:hypothetical protein